MIIDTKMAGQFSFMEKMQKFGNTLLQDRVKQVRIACIYIKNYIQKNKLSGQVLRRRSGQLAKSLSFEVFQKGKDVAGRVGTPKIYSRIHELGGTITAKNTKYLTIPLKAAMTPAGVLRKPAKEYGNTFVRTIGKNKIMFTTEKGRLEPIFLLKTSVKIPQRPYFRPALKETQKKVSLIVGESVKTALRIAGS